MKIIEIILEDTMPIEMQRNFASNPKLKNAIELAYRRLGKDKDWNIAAAKAIDAYSNKMDNQLSNREKADYEKLKNDYVALAKQVRNIQQAQSDKAQKPQPQPTKKRGAPTGNQNARKNFQQPDSASTPSTGTGGMISKALNPFKNTGRFGLGDLDTTDVGTTIATAFKKAKSNFTNTIK